MLCTDLLFQSKQTSPQLVISELCRVSSASEVRVFPLLDEQGRKFLLRSGGSYGFLQERDYGIEVREVCYKLQKVSNAMLRIWTKKLAL